MKRGIVCVALCAFLTCFCIGDCAAAGADASTAAGKLVPQLSALAAQCKLADSANQPTDPRDSKLPEHALRWAHARTACAATAEAKAKPYYRAALASAPAAHDLITRLYARWLTYISVVGSPAPNEDEEFASRKFNDAANELRAQLDAE